jgi:hypothetical protein
MSAPFLVLSFKLHQIGGCDKYTLTETAGMLPLNSTPSLLPTKWCTQAILPDGIKLGGDMACNNNHGKALINDTGTGWLIQFFQHNLQ